VGFEKVQQLVGQIPWGQNILIMSKSKDMEEARSIPDDLKSQLPTIETIEEELEAIKRIIS